MNKIASFVFWLTLVLYIITLCTVSYVGVYLTYITIPVLIISGVIMRITTPNKPLNKSQKKEEKGFHNDVEKVFDDVNKGLDDFNESRAIHWKIEDLVKERSENIENQIKILEKELIPYEIRLKYEDDSKKIQNLNYDISEINLKINKLKKEINNIRMHCELEIKVGK